MNHIGPIQTVQTVRSDEVPLGLDDIVSVLEIEVVFLGDQRGYFVVNLLKVYLASQRVEIDLIVGKSVQAIVTQLLEHSFEFLA